MSSYRQQQAVAATSYSNSTDFASPTDSEFSAGYDEPDYVRNWNMERVADWLESINAGQYADAFRKHDITGANLMDLDQSILKEMGVKKIGDRVRIAGQARRFRYNEYQRRRESVRDSARFDKPIYTPPSSGSPRGPKTGRSDKGHTASRPTSPLHSIDEEIGTRSARSATFTPTPRESAPREQAGAYFQQTAQPVSYTRAKASPYDQTSRLTIPAKRTSLIVDTETANAIPRDKQWIRAIYDNARASVFSVEGCKTAEDIILKTLRRGHLNEGHVKSYCFYILDGTEPVSAYCRRLSDSELVRICTDTTRRERERLIFRKIHGGEPEGSQLQSAAAIALSQYQDPSPPTRSQLKLPKLTGESLPPLSYPMSPASAAERERHLLEAAQGLDSAERRPPRTRKAQELHGARPESELVIADPKQYFPDVDAAKFENLRRMSVRRSQRLSRATNRLSVASNASFASSMEDAPPMPTISESPWFNQHSSIASRGRPLSVYRDSFALDPLDEESPLEPDRKSYVSFGDGDSPAEPESASSSLSNDINITDSDGNTIRKSYFSEASSPLGTEGEGNGSINEQLILAIAEDGEEEDDELTKFLKPDAWENIPYIRGKLIGQGSFGSVYLALHNSTAELMAVKQVELPSAEGNVVDAKRNNMVEALKREIGLLRDLKHKHIVHYLGASADSHNLNIFLEYVPGGSIAKMLVDYGSLNETVITIYVRQILAGLAYLHGKDIIHRDIKGANILVNDKGLVKISDFGISKRVQDSKLLSEAGPGGQRRGRGLAANRVSLQGSVFWMAPEVVKQTAYTRKADIWSLGCLIVEMITGSHPHPDLSQLQAIFKIGGKGADPAPQLPEDISREAKEFLQMTFRIEHESRPEASKLLETAFVNGKRA